MDATEEAGGPPQREEALLPAAALTARGPPRAEIPSGVTGQPNKQHASAPANGPPDMTARNSCKAPDAGQPGTGPRGPTRNAEHATAAPPPELPTGHRPPVTRAPPHPRHQHAAATQKWESRTAPDRGHNLRELVERYPPEARTVRAGPPRREDDPSTISMMVLESGHYYQVRITLHPQECHWNLEAVDSMLPARAALPGGPTTLPHNEQQAPLTAVVSGKAGSWLPEHALYCLWRWAQRCWPHTRHWTATWTFHMDGRQQPEAILQRQRRTETPATTNLCPFFAIYQIRAVAMGGQPQPTIRIETEDQAAHAAIVYEILSALNSALVLSMVNPPGP